MMSPKFNYIVIILLILFGYSCSNKSLVTNQDNYTVFYAKDGTLAFKGKKVAFDKLKPTIKKAVFQEATPPTKIPVEFAGDVMMGTRHEIESQVEEALFEAVHTNAVMDVIHSFYQQYLGKPSEFNEMEFINTTGDHLKLDVPKLEAYLARLKNTNYLSESYLKQLKTYYLKCEKSWQQESKNEPNSCLDADIFTCSQDSPELIYDYFTKTSVVTTYLT
ncbi:MAG: hypothetical protein AAF960_21665, partial [Bacteroidota bacterium]